MLCSSMIVAFLHHPHSLSPRQRGPQITRLLRNGRNHLDSRIRRVFFRQHHIQTLDFADQRIEQCGRLMAKLGDFSVLLNVSISVDATKKEGSYLHVHSIKRGAEPRESVWNVGFQVLRDINGDTKGDER